MDSGASLEQLAARWQAVNARLEIGDAILLSGGADLEYLTGYRSMPLERITALVARHDNETPLTLVLPTIEVARVRKVPGAFVTIGWGDDEDPLDLIVDRLGGIERLVISDHLWSSHLLSLQARLPDVTFVGVTEAIGGMRSIKSQAEIEAILKVGGLVDIVIEAIQSGEVELIGRTESDVAEEISERLLAVGHDSVSFAIVAAGENAASPHHHAGDRVIQADEIVLFDIGGIHEGFSSDTTRCVYTGEIPSEVAVAYDFLMRSQEAGVQAAQIGSPLGGVDDACRSVLDDAGFGEYFTHRTGHGIGAEAHEEPYILSTNRAVIEVGHAFSVEPGVYIEGKWGMRLEDIVVIGVDGPIRANNTDRSLVRVA